MIGVLLLAAALSGELTEKEARKLATFTRHVQTLAVAKGIPHRFEVAPSDSATQLGHAIAWVHCDWGVCHISVNRRKMKRFNGVELEYIAAHEVCHVAHHDADGDIWGMMTLREREERHRHVDICVMGLIGKSKLVNYLFYSGMDDEHIDRYLQRLRWLAHRRYSKRPF